MKDEAMGIYGMRISGSIQMRVIPGICVGEVSTVGARGDGVADGVADNVVVTVLVGERTMSWGHCIRMVFTEEWMHCVPQGLHRVRPVFSCGAHLRVMRWCMCQHVRWWWDRG